MSETLLKPEGRVLPTLEADGSRRWLFPRLAKGRYLTGRRWFAYFLMLVFTAVPFIRVDGKPAVLVDIAGRKLTLLGHTFLPTDTILLALLAVSFGLVVFLTTAVWGRAWCGWACPQTVYMEFVFRPIERLFLGRSGVGGRPAKGLAAWRYAGMYLTYLVVALYLAHTFLSYFVGVDQLRVWVTRSPLEHPWGFFVIVIATAAMMLNASWFREQMCLIACPYGRFQSVLLDRHSRTVRYDAARGEPRGRGRVSLPVVATEVGRTSAAGSKGDCIDCTMCVQVCPTGIDIRDGTQFECINCTQCMDACDAVMRKIGKPEGLVRYASLAQLAGQPSPIVRPRVVAYVAAIAVLLSVLVYRASSMVNLDVLMVRNQGLPFVINPEGLVENTLRMQVTNRTEGPRVVSVTTADPAVRIRPLERASLGAWEKAQLPVHFVASRETFSGSGKHRVEVTVTTEDGVSVRRSVELFGPGGGGVR